MNISQVTEFLGWASIINISILFLVTVCLVVMRDFIASTHSKLFNISKDELPSLYFSYIAHYKTLAIIFFVIPYISLKVMGY